MTKKKKNFAKPEPPPPHTAATTGNLFFNLKNQLIVVILLAIGFYANTFFNEFALDDLVSITGNKYTQKGFKGIPTLFFKDSFYGYFGDSSGLSGGRWRPLALITFAIEHQFFGQNAHINHLNNILIYALTGVVLLLFLRKFVFPQQPYLALLTVVLFIIHPIHTEAVANIKSRDELLSFLFLILTLHFSLNYLNEGKRKVALLLSCLFYFLALLSKENGLTFIAIIPLSFYFFSNETVKKCLIHSLPFILVVAVYLLMRFSFVGFNYVKINDVNISPLSEATTVEWWATIFFALGKYIQLLLFPHPLSADYSYNQIPYTDFTNFYVWISILIQASLLVFAFVRIKKKDLFSYGILFYFLSIFIVSNILIDVGAILGERFLYQASFGFCLCIALLLQFVSERTGSLKKHVSIAFLSFIIFFSAYKTVSRNGDWKNDQTLFIKDVQTCPNSVRTNIAAGTAFILKAETETDSLKKTELLNKAIQHNRKALEISPSAVDPILNLGVAYYNMGNYEMAAQYWKEAKAKGRVTEVQQYERALSINLMNKGLMIAGKNDYNNSIRYFYQSVDVDPSNPDAWYNLGGAYYTIAKYDSAAFAWEKTLQLKPDHANAMKGLQAVRNMPIK